MTSVPGGLEHVFGPEESWPDQDLIAFTDDLDHRLLLLAYRSGVFPMPLHESGFSEVMGWWSPMERGIIPPDGLVVSRSMRKSARRYCTTVDHRFDEVLARCADPSRPHGWIDDSIAEAYTLLHGMGVAHSVETWDDTGGLVGGLYGVSIGGLFAGESMFHDQLRGTDASKVALIRLVQLLDSSGEESLLDVQWVTPHLARLGAVEVTRVDYLGLLADVLGRSGVDWITAANLPARGVLDAGTT